MGFRLTVAGLAGLLLAACVVGPDYRAPQMPLPARWSAAPATATAPAATPALGRWWVRLGDPVLTALIDEAVAGNLDVADAKASIRVARASLAEEGASLKPAVTGSADASRSGTGDGAANSSFRTGFDASWELDLFGANRRAVEAARYGLDAAEEDLRATLLTLVGDVASYYVEARGYQARAALARRTARSQRETAALTRSKFEAGSASAVDVANAEGQAASTAANIPALEAAFVKDVHRLSVLTGRAPAELAERMAAVRPVPRPKWPIPAGVPADLLVNRPDLRLAERQYAQATARIGVAEAARYPAVSLSGDIATSAVRLGDLGKASSISWSFGPSLSVPVFNAGKLAAAVTLAEAERDQSFIAWKAAVLSALEDVENAAVSLSQERRKQASLTEAAAAYRKAADLAHSLYQSGNSSFLDVLDAERSLYSAEDAQLASAVAITSDYVALMKALGGGWDGTVNADRPEIADTGTGPHR